jgi:hypothetical protein
MRTRLLAAAVAAVVGCAAGMARAGDPYATAPAYARAVAPMVTLTPLVTAGQQIPLTGHDPALFRVAGVLDGLGAFGGGGSLTLLANHEFGQTQGGAAGPLPSGARVSELQFTTTVGAGPTATVHSGQNYIEQVYAGEPSTLVAPGTRRIARFCSAFMAGAATGFDRPMLLHGEEATGAATFDGLGGSAFATFDHQIRQLPRLGHAPWENIVALPGTGAKTALIGLEDASGSGDGLNSQLYLYLGTKLPGASDPLAANGLDNGQLYVLCGVDPTRNTEASFNVKGASIHVEWKPVAHAQTDAQLDAQSRALGSFRFVRVEDGAPDRRQPGDFFFATSGAPGTVNPYGRIYRLRFDAADPAGPAALTLLLGGSEGIVSPDNIDVNDRGEMLICEDPNYNLSAPPLGLSRDTYVWRYVLATAQLTAIAEVSRSPAIAHALAADPLNSNTIGDSGPGDWEFSGVIDAEPYTGPGTWFLDVQAHSLRINPVAQTVQGGQILLLHIPVDVEAVISGLELIATAVGVQVLWDASADVEGFEVWRSASLAGPWQRLTRATLATDVRTYLDVPPNGVWYYRVDGLVAGAVAASAGPHRIEVRSDGRALAIFQSGVGSVRGEATIAYSIPAEVANTHIRIVVFDVTGRIAATLYDGTAATGRNLVIWKPETRASGTYFARLETHRGVRTSRVTLLR